MQLSDYLLMHTGLTKGQASRLESICSSKQAKAGEYLIQQGKVCKSVFFINSGCVSMSYEKPHKIFIKDFIFEGDFATVYESFITKEPARYALKTVTACTYQSISYLDLQNVFETNHEQLSKLEIKLAKAAYLNVTRRIESLLTLSAEQRYIELLNKRPRLIKSIPLYLIASYLGITPVALSRVRKDIFK
jgi:CRP-like cAMP-binding protein